jgi:hypothetical protein
MARSARWLLLCALLGVTAIACSESGIIPDPSGEPDAVDDVWPSNLVISESEPPTGDATLIDAATLVIDEGGSGRDELTLTQTVGENAHTVVVTWDTLTHVIVGVSHVWGPGPNHGGTTSGFTACFAGINDCDPAKVTLDMANSRVTLSGLVLDDVFGGAATSTLTGRIGW